MSWHCSSIIAATVAASAMGVSVACDRAPAEPTLVDAAPPVSSMLRATQARDERYETLASELAKLNNLSDAITLLRPYMSDQWTPFDTSQSASWAPADLLLSTWGEGNFRWVDLRSGATPDVPQVVQEIAKSRGDVICLRGTMQVPPFFHTTSSGTTYAHYVRIVNDDACGEDKQCTICGVLIGLLAPRYADSTAAKRGLYVVGMAEPPRSDAR